MNREPVLTAGAITGVLMAGLFMAVSLGWLHLTETQLGSVETFAGALLALLMLNSLGVLSLTEAQLDAIKSFLIPAVAIVGPIIASAWARQQVTPLADPRTKDSEPAVIVPVAQAQQAGILPGDE